MPPEYEETDHEAVRAAHAGSTGERFTSTGTVSRSPNPARSTSPAIADPPMPQNATTVTPSASGKRLGRPAGAYAAARVGASDATAPSMSEASRARSASTSSRSTVVIGRAGHGFSASSISITGMSSRIG